MSTSMSAHGPISISVAPAQAAYFAGEPFSFTITFRNTNESGENGTANSPRSASFAPGHRAAHSISSAPIAKPPTSPGTPKTIYNSSTQSPPTQLPGDPLRKGLVGQRHEGPRSPASSSKQRAASKSLSVNVGTPQDILNRLGAGPDGKPMPLSARAGLQSPSSPRVSSPLRREPILPASHPHARKHSLQELTLPTTSFSSSAPSSAQQHSAHPRPPHSAFPLTLDPIREFLRSPLSPSLSPSPSQPPPPNTNGDANGANGDANGDAIQHSQFKRQQPPPTPTASETASPTTSQPQLLPPFKFGRASSTPSVATPVPYGRSARQRSASTTSHQFVPAGTELLLWAYAQLSGTLELDSEIIRPETQTSLRQQLRAARVIGGGRMHLEDGMIPSAPSKPATGFFASLFGSASPVSSPVSTPSSFLQAEDEKTLPTLETRQTMLVVDLNLGPGEAKSFKYTTSLPAMLPPTFRGRAFKLSYTLVLGACRAEGGSTRRQYSRVMKVPIRLYNHVAVGRMPSPYDLLWPVARRRERPAECIVNEVQPETRPGKGSELVKTSRSTSSAVALNDFARRLLEVRDRGHLDAVELPAEGPRLPVEESPRELNTSGSGAPGGCKEAVEIVTRNPKKRTKLSTEVSHLTDIALVVSFDVNKDGRQVAVLTFVKSAYRLGETILGVLEFNTSLSGPRVLELSAMLEAHETLPATWLVDSQSLRRVHAEHHEALAVGVSRTGFALNIPSDASPAFGLSVGGDDDIGGIEWKVRLCLLVAVPPKNAVVDEEGTHLVLDHDRSSAWATSWHARAGISPLSTTTSMTRGMSSALLTPGGVGPLSALSPMTPSTWTAMLTSPFSATGPSPKDWNVVSHGAQRGAGGEWRLETVECEVPVRVWPGNTAFRPADVIFDV